MRPLSVFVRELLPRRPKQTEEQKTGTGWFLLHLVVGKLNQLDQPEGRNGVWLLRLDSY